MINRIRWVEAKYSEGQNYLTAWISIGSDKFKIKFATDTKTMHGLKSVLTMKPFKEKHGGEYKYEYAGYSVSKSSDEYHHYVLIRLNSMRRKEKIACSKQFCQNLRWLIEINSRSELSEIIIS